MRHVLSVLVENHPGVLRRVSGLFSRRGYNIDSLVVSSTEDSEMSRMTITVMGDENVIDQVTKQLSKLVEVVEVEDITGKPIVDRQLLLIKVKATSENIMDIITLVEPYKVRISDISKETLMLEATDENEKIESIIEILKPFGIIELIKTGSVALVR